MQHAIGMCDWHVREVTHQLAVLEPTIYCAHAHYVEPESAFGRRTRVRSMCRESLRGWGAEKRRENRRAAYKVNARNDVPALATIFSLENLSASTVGTSSKVAHLGVCKPNADGNGDPGWGRH